MKKLTALLCAGAFALSAVGSFPSAAEPNTAKTATIGESEETKLPAPTNVREENGFIVWDEVPDAYGYTVRTQIDNEEVSQTYYETKAEWKRFLHEQSQSHSLLNLNFGNYKFEVRAFDRLGSNSTWSEKVTVSYVPSFDAAITLSLVNGDEGTVYWNEVNGAAAYNMQINKEDGTAYDKNFSTGGSYTNWWWWGWVHETGNYTLKVQAMDTNYNVSNWSEPLAVTYTAPTNKAPQNVRLDESGNYILWDAVDGVENYQISVQSGTGGNHLGGVKAPPCQSEWKYLVSPFSSSNRHIINVLAPNEKGSWDFSESIITDFTPVLDKTLEIPDGIKYEDGLLGWRQNEGEDYSRSWLRVSAYGNYFGHGENGNTVNMALILPQGTYTVDSAINGMNGTYNTRTDSLTVTDLPDESVWVPKLYYKFDQLVWDWDKLRHPETTVFWLRISTENGTVVDLKQINYYNVFDSMLNFEDGDYIAEICANNTATRTVGKWSEPLHITIHSGGLFDKENESTSPVETPPEAAGVPDPDKITSITINPAFNMKNKHDTNVELDLTKIKIKAKEIYDEAGLKRAEEALGKEIIGNKHYNLLDLTLLYDGQDFSDGYDGLVQVIIPLPKGHRDKTFSCYRLTEVNGKLTKELIPGEQTEDSYIIYLEHFSEYALVADGGEAPDDPGHTHAFSGEWKSDGASHWHECECGEKSGLASHAYGEWTNSGNFRTRTCAACNYTETASVGGTGNPGYRPPNPPVSADNTDNAAAEPERDDKESDPADPKDEDAEEPEPDETDRESDVDADTDENDDDEYEDGEEYDDTCSKDEPDSEFDTEGARSEPISAEEANARDENPGTGVSVNGLMLLASLAAGAAALTAGRKKASRR